MGRKVEPASRTLKVPPPAAAGAREARRPVPEITTFLSLEAEPEEALIIDARSHCRPAQMVERKLVSVLGRGVLPASHVRTTALLAGRRRG
jgi:hypothetical protein